MIRLDELKDIISENGLKFEGRHLLLPIEKPSSKQRLKIVKKIFESLDETRIENSRFFLQKRTTCRFDNCVAPCCYDFKLKHNLGDTLLSKEDIKEIAEEIDIERIKEIGLEKYLEEYNRGQVELLKISMDELKLVYEYAKGK